MKYAVWFVRLVYGAWMVPAGLEHFIHIFPQPMGGTPLSSEVINALLASHLFDVVKAVELVAGGLCVLSGFYTPLALVVCMPVSFNVFYWDTPLMGWGSPWPRSAPSGTTGSVSRRPRRRFVAWESNRARFVRLSPPPSRMPA